MSQDDTSKPSSSAITAEQVAAYLQSNDDFFLNHEDLLTELRIPQETGKVVSLVEKQVGILRERNIEMRHRLSSLLDVARDNDKLFDKTQRLVLALLEAKNLPEITSTIDDSLRTDFQTDICSLIIFGDSELYEIQSSARIIDSHDAHLKIPSLLKSTRAVCGALRTNELEFLFENEANNVNSAAVVPLINNGVIGVLAIGSFDADHFRSSMGTMFLSYIGDVLSLILPHFIHDSPVTRSASQQ